MLLDKAFHSGWCAELQHHSSRDLSVTVGKLWARRGQRAGYRYPINEAGQPYAPGAVTHM